MTMHARHRGGHSRALGWFTALLAVAIFLADTLTDYEVAAATFYVVVVLLASRLLSGQPGGRRDLLLAAAGCIVLTVLSYALTRHGNVRNGIVNTAISIVAIAAVAWLAVRAEAARALAQQAQAHLARVTRATTLGEMGAVIAHEVNQPLAAIVANASACQRWMAAEPANLPRTAQSIEAIVEDATRASAIIARVRALAVNTAPNRAPTDPGAVIGEAVALVEPQRRMQGVALRLDLPANLPPVLIDAVQVQQVVLNLLLNALEAMDGSGGEITIGAEVGDAGHLRITIADTGPGLTDEQAARIFTPFQSTKPGGMGIGLAICRSIIETHGGRIEAHNRPEGGACLCFTLPIALGGRA